MFLDMFRFISGLISTCQISRQSFTDLLPYNEGHESHVKGHEGHERS